jgi:hypothetical protein
MGRFFMLRGIRALMVKGGCAGPNGRSGGRIYGCTCGAPGLADCQGRTCRVIARYPSSAMPGSASPVKVPVGRRKPPYTRRSATCSAGSVWRPVPFCWQSDGAGSRHSREQGSLTPARLSPAAIAGSLNWSNRWLGQLLLVPLRDGACTVPIEPQTILMGRTKS